MTFLLIGLCAETMDALTFLLMYQQHGMSLEANPVIITMGISLAFLCKAFLMIFVTLVFLLFRYFNLRFPGYIMLVILIFYGFYGVYSNVRTL